jgi:hypothetical protein
MHFVHHLEFKMTRKHNVVETGHVFNISVSENGYRRFGDRD